MWRTVHTMVKGGNAMIQSPVSLHDRTVPTDGHVRNLYCNVYCFRETWPVGTRGHGSVMGQ